ncbi:MAG: flagellar hook protein FlgE [Oligoflexia bacterium]|nr:flagellar hook protein FlgE [Oligoflexia bacterium]
MRIESALYASREGLDAHGKAISVVGDNVANANTVGYKTSRVEFADLFPDGKDGRQSGALPSSGGGSSVARVRQIHETGVLEATGRPLDVGIAGDGFFIVGDGDNQFYTRAGNFQINEDGLLVTADGEPVLGLQGTGTTLGTLNVKSIDTTGAATSLATIYGNLASSAETTTVPTNPQTFTEINSLATFIATASVNDSLGGIHDVSLAFFKTDTNEWTAQAYLDGGEVGGTKGVPVQLGSNATLTFDSSGSISTANAAAAKITATPTYSSGAAAGNFQIDLSKFSQFASTSIVNSFSQDGKSVGNIKSYQFQADGTLLAVLDTGSTAQVGKIQLAQFPNTDALERAGNSLFRAGDGSGTPTVSDPGDEGSGKLEGNSLERSTVDIANQFIDLVLYQRGYQANSQILNAADQLIQGTLQLMR